MKPEEIERQFASGERILDPQTGGQIAYVIRSGTVRLEGRQSSGDECLGPGDLFGAVAAVLGEPYGYTAVAESDVEVLVLDIEVLNSLCIENSEFAMRLIRHLADRVATAADTGAAPRAGARPTSSRSFRRVCEVLLSRLEEGEPPCRVAGTLALLAEAADLSLIEAYLQIQQLLDDRVLRLAEDVLTVEEPERLASLLENPRG